MIEINDKYINELPDTYKISYLDYKKGLFYTEQWGSHQPVLIHTLNTITNGDVIEFGMGDNSTQLLHLLCEKQGRKLFSYEFDKNWYDKYTSYENDNHKIFLLDEKKCSNNEYTFNQHKYSVVFIDSAPAWTRQYGIDYFKDCADYFVIHDVAKIFEDGRIKIINKKVYDLSCFKTFLIFKKVDKATGLCTNKEVPTELSKIFE